MKRIPCPDCNRKLGSRGQLRVGGTVTCSTCKAFFEIVSLNPPVLEWLYDDETVWQEDEAEWDETDGYNTEEAEDRLEVEDRLEAEEDWSSST